MSDSKLDIDTLINDKLSIYGKTICLLGTSDFGETNNPILIKSIAQLYGTFGTKGTLIDAFKLIKEYANDINILCCKVSGTYSATCLNINIENDNVVQNAFVIRSINSNEIYNDISITLLPDGISFDFPEKLKTKSVTYLYKDYPTFKSLIDKIDYDTENGLNHVTCRCTVDEDINIVGALDTVNQTITYLYGGNSGLTISKNNLYYCLKDTLKILEGYPVDIIVPLNAYIDDLELDDSLYGVSKYGDNSYLDTTDKLRVKENNQKVSYYDLLLEYCINQLNFGIITLGVMGYNKTPDKYINENIDNYVNDVLISMLKENQIKPIFEDYRQLISVIGGDIISSNQLENINGYILYSAMLADINTIDTPCNKQCKDDIYIFNEFNNEQLLKLSENGIVAFRHSPLKDSTVCSSCVTTCLKDDFKYIQNVRMIQCAVSCIYTIIDQCIGENIYYLMKDNLLRNYIASGLNILLSKNIISKYKLSLKQTNRNDIKIDLDLKTMYMIDFIKAEGYIEIGDVNE